MDIKLVGTNSSDPYYLLYAVDAAGALKRLGKSNTVKANLNPEWEVLELRVRVRQLRARVRVRPKPKLLALARALALALTLTLTRCSR